MVQALRALAAVLKDPDSIPSTHVVTQLSVTLIAGDLVALFWLQWAPGIHMAHIHSFMQAKQNKNLKIFNHLKGGMQLGKTPNINLSPLPVCSHMHIQICPYTYKHTKKNLKKNEMSPLGRITE